MSALFGSTKAIPAPKAPALGMDGDLAPTNYQSRPAPYLAGTRRIGLTWISQAFDVVITDAPAQGGSKKASGGGAKDYHASAAGLLCHGPADLVSQIWFDNQLVWEGSLARGGSSYVDITIEDRGVMRLYWGTTTQARDPDLEDLETATDPDARELHPAYRGFCYVVFKGLYLGTARTQFPQVEIVLSRWPTPDWLSVSGNLQGDANPVAVVWDWITNGRLGGGFPETRLNTSALASVAAQLDAECAGVSPYITSGRSLRQNLAELLEYVDGYPRPTPGGLLELGLVRPTCVTSPVWDETALTEEPRVDTGDWSEVVTMTVLRFTNRFSSHKEDAVTVEDLGAAQALGSTKVATVERRWITRPNQAWAVAQAEARAAGIPALGGSLKVRRSRAVGIRQGDQFRLSWAQWGVCNLPCRVTSISIPPPDRQEAEVTFVADRGHLTVLLAPPPVYVPPPRRIYGPVPFEHARLIEMPCALTPNNDSSVGNAWAVVGLGTGGGGGGGSAATKRAVSFLVARPSSLTDSWTAHYRVAPGSYTAVGSSRQFSLRGTLTTSVLDSATSLSVEFAGIDTLPPDSWAPSALALIIGDEWCMVDGIGSLSGPATYPVEVVRGGASTTAEGYVSGTEVWLVSVPDLLVVSALAPCPDHVFKLAPAVMAASLPLGEATPQTISLVLACPV
jgi:hypothetical protein